MNRQKAVFAGLAAVAVGTGVLILSGELPRWRSGGTAMVLDDPIAATGPCAAVGAGPVNLLFLGDSNMSGSRVGGGANAFPGLLQAAAGGRFVVTNRAFGGAVLTDAAAQMQDAGPADLVVIMFGGNDAAARGLLTNKVRVPVDQFRSTMAALVRSWRERGAQVLVLADVPAGSAAMASRIAPYRQAARDGALAGGGCFQDPMQAFAANGADAVYLQYDALHLNPAGQKTLAHWLLSVISASDASNARSSRFADA